VDTFLFFPDRVCGIWYWCFWHAKMHQCNEIGLVGWSNWLTHCCTYLWNLRENGLQNDNMIPIEQQLHNTNMANVPSTIGVFWSYAYMEGIWVFKLWTNYFFCCCGGLFLNATFGYRNMTCWPKCNVCVLEASIWYVWGITTLGPSPMCTGWIGGWYFGAPYWFYNLRRSY
jgi:hypothetical protein